jgi:hypothetical protein
MSASADRHLEWRHFRLLIERGVPAVQPISGDPSVVLFVDEDGGRIGLRTPSSGVPDTAPSPLAEIESEFVVVGGLTYLQVSTRSENLFAEFYLVLEELADRIQIQSEIPLHALQATLANFRALLRPTNRMTDEQRIGLFGELVVLYRYLQDMGEGAVAGWTGVQAEPHDFRVGRNEVEVKTTLSRRRSHVITSLAQLEATPGRSLYLMSIQLEPAGVAAGLSLPELVDMIRTALPHGSSAREVFEAGLLLTWRYADIHAPFYLERLQPRAPAALIEVDEDFPRLTSDLVGQVPKADRIRDVQYRVDVTGLGFEEGQVDCPVVVPGVMPF